MRTRAAPIQRHLPLRCSSIPRRFLLAAIPEGEAEAMDEVEETDPTATEEEMDDY